MPATPMNEAAERYSPEIADAFHPTDTDRPATKKSLAVFDFRADQIPIQMVTATVMNENVKIQGSTRPNCARKSGAIMFSAAPSRSELGRLHLLPERSSA